MSNFTKSLKIRLLFATRRGLAQRSPYIFFAQIPLLFLSGCGYSRPGDPSANSWYQWKSLYRGDVKSVAVPIFTNKTYDRGVEFSLSKAIVNEVEMRTPYKVMPRERADTVLEGEIVAVSRQTLSSDPTADIPQEQLYVVRINFVWKDLRSGQILCERRNFEQTATFYPTLAEDQFVGSQQNCEKLALGIVQEMQANW